MWQNLTRSSLSRQDSTNLILINLQDPFRQTVLLSLESASACSTSPLSEIGIRMLLPSLFVIPLGRAALSVRLWPSNETLLLP
jgi:hypothetical protein